MELITTMWLAPDGGTNPKGLEDASGCSPKMAVSNSGILMDCELPGEAVGHFLCPILSGIRLEHRMM